jgi:hypothetical protein
MSYKILCSEEAFSLINAATVVFFSYLHETLLE